MARVLGSYIYIRGLANGPARAYLSRDSRQACPGQARRLNPSSRAAQRGTNCRAKHLRGDARTANVLGHLTAPPPDPASGFRPSRYRRLRWVWSLQSCLRFGVWVWGLGSAVWVWGLVWGLGLGSAFGVRGLGSEVWGQGLGSDVWRLRSGSEVLDQGLGVCVECQIAFLCLSFCFSCKPFLCFFSFPFLFSFRFPPESGV